MKTFNASQKSRIPFLLFILSFSTLPGALHRSAQTTGNYTLNNYAHRSTKSNWETRFYTLTKSVSSGQDYCTLPIPDDVTRELIIPAVFFDIDSVLTSIITIVHNINKKILVSF